jgi:hypothetical protein
VRERTNRNEASPPEIIGEHLRELPVGTLLIGAFLIGECRTDIFILELEPSIKEETERREKSKAENAGFEQ